MIDYVGVGFGDCLLIVSVGLDVAARRSIRPRNPTPLQVEQGNEPVGADEVAAGEESEVELDSLGRLFVELAVAPSSQDNIETSRAGNVEVISISSNLETFIPKKTRRAVRKVPFSHPDTHLDQPNSSVKIYKYMCFCTCI